jgi:hypothetical protein
LTDTDFKSLSAAYKDYRYLVADLLEVSPVAFPVKKALLPAFDIRVGDFVELIPDHPVRWGRIGRIETMIEHSLLHNAEKLRAESLNPSFSDSVALREVVENLEEGHGIPYTNSISINQDTNDAIKALLEVQQTNFYWIRIVRRPFITCMAGVALFF